MNSTFEGETELNENLVEVGDLAFGSSEFIGELVIPDSVETIGTGAFQNSNFSGNLVIPKTVQYIGGYYLYKSYFDSVQNNSNATIESWSIMIANGYYMKD